MIHARTASGTKPGALLRMRTATGLGVIAIARLRTAAGLEGVWSGSNSLTATVDSSVVYGARSAGGALTVRTETATVSVTGGLAPYTFAWGRTASSGGVWSIDDPSAASTRFSCAGVGADDTYDAAFTCTITDAAGRTATIGVAAYVFNYGSYGGIIP